MNLKRTIQTWLGIHDLANNQKQILYIISQPNKEIEIHNRALARLIAKLDPMFGVSEFDPSRVAASKKLEQDIMNKIIAENEIQRRYQP